MRNAINTVGEFGYLLYQVILNVRFAVTDRKRIAYQLDHMGVNSIPLVILVGFFAGSIIAWQAAYQFKGMISLSVMGGQASRVIVMEMGPVLTALVISGRIGASMTAEIGTMKVTEQVDALRTMAIDPVRYIVLPRFLGLTIMLPVLTMFANLIGIFGAYVVSNYFLDISHLTFLQSLKSFFQTKDMMGGLFKSVVFGILISLVGCYIGMNTSGGARGVGKATIQSFVFSAILILVSDYFLWLILF